MRIKVKANEISEKKLNYLLISIMVLVGLFGVFFVTIELLNFNEEINCNAPFDVVYFKPSEIAHIPEFLDKHPSGIAVIPEYNQVNANTEILNCPSFHYGDYIEGDF